MKLARFVMSLVFLAPLLGAGDRQPEPAARPVVEELQAEAEALRPLMKSEVARAFLAQTAALPEPTARGIHRNKERTRALTDKQFAELEESEREGFTRREFPPRFYYHTGYGTPLIFARVLELLSEHDAAGWTPERMTSKRIADFGCGTLGHLRLLASLGVDATGIDVEPVFQALYSEPGDQGEVEAQNGAKGRTRLLTGHWPGDNAVRTTAGEGYDAFISKNTLKRGYIHPARETDPSRLVHLGVTDEEFVKAVYSALKPGGVFLIYNIAPAQAPADQPYLPHADGRCPFDREVLEKAGFEVVKYDEDDQETIIDYWRVLGLNHGKTEEELKGELFAWWTLCRKPVKDDVGRRPARGDGAN
jgi:SAM-dependent methyltransferase